VALWRYMLIDNAHILLLLQDEFCSMFPKNSDINMSTWEKIEDFQRMSQ